MCSLAGHRTDENPVYPFATAGPYDQEIFRPAHVTQLRHGGPVAQLCQELNTRIPMNSADLGVLDDFAGKYFILVREGHRKTRVVRFVPGVDGQDREGSTLSFVERPPKCPVRAGRAIDSDHDSSRLRGPSRVDWGCADYGNGTRCLLHTGLTDRAET
jgi:hypothetical protein